MVVPKTNSRMSAVKFVIHMSVVHLQKISIIYVGPCLFKGYHRFADVNSKNFYPISIQDGYWVGYVLTQTPNLFSTPVHLNTAVVHTTVVSVQIDVCSGILKASQTCNAIHKEKVNPSHG